MSLLENQSVEFNAVLAALRAARRVLFITGAGVSAESGLPTYRGIGGLYNDKATDDGVPIELALSAEMLEQRPAITWKYLRQIESGCRRAGFNAAHKAMADLQEHMEVWVLTQNIDGFHGDAGSQNVIEIHGNARHLRCCGCDWQEEVADYSQWDSIDGAAPACPQCGKLIRPEVVLFGEMLPSEPLARLHQELATGFDLVISVGTSSVFPYIVEPVLMAKRAGVRTVEINPAQTEISDWVDWKFQQQAGELLPAWLECLAKQVR